MTILKELLSFILGLFLIILGFLTFSYIEYVNQRPALSGFILYYIIAIGFIFIFLGSLFMVFYVRSDLKKKSSK